MKNQEHMQEIAEHLFSIGLRKNEIVLRLQHQFSISRATAYRVCAAAITHIEKTFQHEQEEETLADSSSDEIRPQSLFLEDKQALMRMARQMCIESYLSFLESKSLDDARAFSSLNSTYERLQRMGGQTAELSQNSMRQFSHYKKQTHGNS